MDVNKQNVELTKILDIVEGTLKEHKLFDQIIIEEKSDGFFLKLKSVNKQEKINRFNSLAGTAISAGEDIKHLMDMTSRKDE